MTLRFRSYKAPSMVGSVLLTIGSILFARMTLSTRPGDVILAMIAAGLGMGLIMPAYTVAVQNAAPRQHMGVATATSTFFRSIGSTVGVAIFGSLLLTRYHHDFQQAVPPNVPAYALTAFSNPLLLPQMHAQLATTFSRFENGPHLLESLYGNVGKSLLGGIQLIFLISAVLMVGLLGLNAFIKSVPLQHGPPPTPPAEP